MRLLASVLLVAFGTCSLQLAGKPGQLKPVGYLKVEYSARTPISLVGKTTINSHIFNVSDAPLRLEVTSLTYNPMFVYVALPQKGASRSKEYGVWGPPTGKALSPKDYHILISGIDLNCKIPTWPKRPGIILLRDEGYARKITFLPKWVSSRKIPQGTKRLILDDSPSLAVSSPVLRPDAVKPGKPVMFQDAKKVYAPGARYLPFEYLPKLRNKSGLKVGRDEESGVCVEIEVPGKIKADQDLKLTYLVGNTGKKSIWIVQQSIVQAHLACTVYQGGRVVAKVDGESLRPFLSLAPLRRPVPLNPGEYLSFKRIIMAEDLKLRKGVEYVFEIKISPEWYPTSIIKEKYLKTAPLKSRILVRTK